MRSGLVAPRVATVRGALAVVFAVLSMHTVDGGAHSPSSAAHAVSAGSSALGPMQAHLDDISNGVSATARVAVIALTPPAVPGDSALAAAVCIAVLLGVVLVVRPGWRRRGSRHQLRSTWARGIDRAQHAFPGRPPDLLTELCVMRT